MKELIDKLEQNHLLTKAELVALITGRNPELDQYLFVRAQHVSQQSFARDIYIRGLIELTNYCKNDCLYCGIRKSNHHIKRYRLTSEQILACCQAGYQSGFRTFVLQGGEDPYFSDERLCGIIRKIKNQYPDCAVTLSLGEKSRDSYQAYYDAGADRYLLRHETANEKHYRQLHPPALSIFNRRQCLYDLKEIGFQVGCGIMVGSPFQTAECLAEDILFMQQLDPEMVGIGPFIPQQDTPLGQKPAGTLEMTLFMLGLVRLVLPYTLLPSTTALGTIHPRGRELGIMAGANVIMPNLSPPEVRENYLLYDHKSCTGDEALEGFPKLQQKIEKIGYRIVVSRGDYKKIAASVLPQADCDSKAKSIF